MIIVLSIALVWVLAIWFIVNASQIPEYMRERGRDTMKPLILYIFGAVNLAFLTTAGILVYAIAHV